MQKINLLDTQVANLIAAGEVVERPASAIKELLENSIDAGATAITAEIKNGGVSLMRITDNGCGMSKEDALVCTRRHATSKIKEASDLDGIVTLGFRGEALAAISSVSKMRIMTRTKDSELGVIVESEAGNIVSCEESGCPVGTTIIVEELFANVPARRKFLKRDASETAAVSAVVEKMALSRPDISFKFITDGNLRFQTAGDNSLVNVIYAVLGRDFAKKTVKVHDMTDGVEVEGVIGTPDNVRGNRGAENFFINGRYVRCGTAAAALEQAFSSYIPSDKFPSCVLAITVNPAFVDVNVHPQKLEVKFSNDKPIFNAVYCAVKNTLMNGIDRPTMGGTKLTGDSYRLYQEVISIKTETDAEADAIASEKERLTRKYEQITVPVEEKTVLPEIDVAVPKPILMPWETDVKPAPSQVPSFAPASAPRPTFSERPATVTPGAQSTFTERPATVTPGAQSTFTERPATVTPGAQSTFTERPATVTPEAVSAQSEIPSRDAESNEKPSENGTKTPENSPEMPQNGPISVPFFKIAGVMFNTYIFVELEDKMMIIDKHAAHERVLFEQMRSNMSRLEPVSQLLLFPVSVPLTPMELASCAEYREELMKLGFDFVDGEGCVDLIQYPLGLNDGQSVTMFAELASRLSDGHGDLKIGRDAFYEKALYQASCKAAVKGGREDSPENIRWIAEQVIVNPNIRFCPHGRPVAFEMTKKEFEKQFERT